MDQYSQIPSFLQRKSKTNMVTGKEFLIIWTTTLGRYHSTRSHGQPLVVDYVRCAVEGGETILQNHCRIAGSVVGKKFYRRIERRKLEGFSTETPFSSTTFLSLCTKRKKLNVGLMKSSIRCVNRTHHIHHDGIARFRSRKSTAYQHLTL